MGWLKEAWRFLKNEENQKTLAFVGGGIAVVRAEYRSQVLRYVLLLLYLDLSCLDLTVYYRSKHADDDSSKNELGERQ